MRDKSYRLFERLQQSQLIALLAPATPQQCVTVYQALAPMGVVLEIAYRSPAAAAGIEAVLAHDPDALIMAGTVMTAAQARQAIEAGVAGVISADFMPAVVETCVARGVTCIPGGLADAGKQLVVKAQTLDCDLDQLRQEHPYQWLYKLFPAFTATGANIGFDQGLAGTVSGFVGGLLGRRDAGPAGSDFSPRSPGYCQCLAVGSAGG